MTDQALWNEQLAAVVEHLQALVLADDASLVPPELVPSLEDLHRRATEQGELQDLCTAFMRIREMIETPERDLAQLLPEIFTLQDAIQDVSVHMTPEDASVEWETAALASRLAQLGKHDRYLLADVTGRGITVYLLTVQCAEGTYPADSRDLVSGDAGTTEGTTQDSIDAVGVETRSWVEERCAVVAELPDTRAGQCAFLVADEMPSGAELPPFLQDITVLPLDRGVLLQILNEPNREEEPRQTSVTVSPMHLDSLRFFRGWLPRGDAVAPALAQELSRTVQQFTGVTVPEIVDELREEVNQVAAMNSRRVLLSVGEGLAPVRREYREMVRDVLREVLANAVTHGIETPEERTAAGKDVRGTVRVFASVEEYQFVLRVVDDGRGIDEAEVKRGLARGNTASGLGRVRQVVTGSLKGTVTLKSSGRGTTVAVTLPHTAQSWNARFFSRQGTSYVVPAFAVVAIQQDGASGIVTDITGGQFLRHTGTLIPVIEPRGTRCTTSDEAPSLLILRSGDEMLALATDGSPEAAVAHFHTDGTVRVVHQEVLSAVVANAWPLRDATNA